MKIWFPCAAEIKDIVTANTSRTSTLGPTRRR